MTSPAPGEKWNQIKALVTSCFWMREEFNSALSLPTCREQPSQNREVARWLKNLSVRLTPGLQMKLLTSDQRWSVTEVPQSWRIYRTIGSPAETRCEATVVCFQQSAESFCGGTHRLRWCSGLFITVLMKHLTNCWHSMFQPTWMKTKSVSFWWRGDGASPDSPV